MASLEGQAAHYLGRVLRVAPGQTIVLFNGDGFDYVSEVADARKARIELTIQTRLPARPESPLNVTLLQAVSRGERMDYTLQKCTELGASAFQPLWTDRVEVRLRGDKLARKRLHWQGVVVSACEQSGRAIVPDVREPLGIQELGATPDGVARLVLDPAAERSLAAVTGVTSLELVVGPEGGLTDAESSVLERAGAVSVSLGPRVLRTETAAPAALAVLQAVLGDFR